MNIQQYYKYDQLRSLFNGLEQKFPDLAAVESIGKSVEGREIVVLHVTAGVKVSCVRCKISFKIKLVFIHNRIRARPAAPCSSGSPPCTATRLSATPSSSSWRRYSASDRPINVQHDCIQLLISYEVLNNEVHCILKPFSIQYLTANFGKEERVTALLNSTDLWLMPALNIDGFENAR